MGKNRVGRYSNEFWRMAVERLKQCDNVVALAEELGIHRRLLLGGAIGSRPMRLVTSHPTRRGTRPSVKRSTSSSGCGRRRCCLWAPQEPPDDPIESNQKT